jgi:hypothetical protein
MKTPATLDEFYRILPDRTALLGDVSSDTCRARLDRHAGAIGNRASPVPSWFRPARWRRRADRGTDSPAVGQARAIKRDLERLSAGH